MKARLTDRQRDVLAFICAHLRACGAPPPIRTIGKHFGITSTNGVIDHLRALERKGYIARTFDTACAMRVLHSDDGLPIIFGVSDIERDRVLAVLAAIRTGVADSTAGPDADTSPDRLCTSRATAPRESSRDVTCSPHASDVRATATPWRCGGM